MKKSELLMPAGSLMKMKTAILYGADAVYAGTPDMSLRTKSQFGIEELKEGITFAHAHGKKVYLTLNLFSHNKDIEKLPHFLATVRELKPDGVIVADPGVFAFVKEHAPEIELHVSTQANVCSWLTVDFWKKQGADLVVLAREVSFEELKEIREKHPDIKLEAFVHGSMCMTYSGRCLLSNFMAERGANQGNCAGSCRWNYHLHVRLKDGTVKDLQLNDENREMFEFALEEEFRPGEYMPIEEDSRGSYILNAKDLCLLPKIREYLELGIDSLKVEGRNKTQYYAAMVARAYRRAIDAYYEDPDNFDPQKYMEDIYSVQNRGYSLAFHEGRLTELAHNYYNAKSVSGYEFAGFISAWDGDDIIFEVKNTLEAGELIELMSPVVVEPIRLRFQEYVDADTGEKVEKVNPGAGKRIRMPSSMFPLMTLAQLQEALPTLTVARKKKKLTPDEQARLLLDIKSHKAEIEGSTLDPVYKQQVLERLARHTEKVEKMAKKGPKMGVEGCCGKGCNGCLIFWKDDKYAAAREELAKRPMGTRLQKKSV